MNLNINSAESLVAQTQGLSAGNAQDLAHLHNLLKQSDELLHSSDSTLLSQLDPSKHSLGYLYVLEACKSGPVSKERFSEVALLIARFIDACKAEQIRLAPDKFISVCTRFKGQVLLVEAPLRGVAPMLAALRKLQTSSEQLTTLHPDFLLLCLLAKCYRTGLSVLEDYIYEVDQPRDFFLYCYYGGMICIGQKQFHKALELLHNVVTASMPTLNAIAVEAYKKYILVSLIHIGQFSASFPKYTTSVPQRNLKNFSQPYLDLANCYGTGRISELESCVQTNKEKFDLNNGTVKEAKCYGRARHVMLCTFRRSVGKDTDFILKILIGSPKSSIYESLGALLLK